MRHYQPFPSVQNDFSAKEYRDATELGGGVPTGATYPSADAAGNPLETEFGLSTYRDSQTLTIQEMPEAAPLGQLPRSLDVYVEVSCHALCSSVPVLSASPIHKRASLCLTIVF